MNKNDEKFKALGKLSEIYPKIINLYKDVDRAHGKSHIRLCIDNALFGLQNLTEEEKVGMYWTTREQVLLSVAFHDIGLIPDVVAMVEPGIIESLKGDSSDVDAIRKNHNTIGATFFKNLFQASKEYRDFMYDRGFTVEDYTTLLDAIDCSYYCDDICRAIKHHRASVNQPTWLSKFVRCCDGVNEPTTILIRAYLYGKDNYPDNSKAQEIKRIKEHLTNKYLENGYGSKFQFMWAKIKMENTVNALHNFLDNLEESETGYTKLEQYISGYLEEYLED